MILTTAMEGLARGTHSFKIFRIVKLSEQQHAEYERWTNSVNSWQGFLKQTAMGVANKFIDVATGSLISAIKGPAGPTEIKMVGDNPITDKKE